MSPKISYFSKEPIECPICGEKFKKENVLTGGGRFNAGELTLELRRIYIPTKKYGKVNPLLYPVVVCPQCFYAAYLPDFSQIPENKVEQLKLDMHKRQNLIYDLFGLIDFRKERTTKEGLASYIAAIYSYAFFPDRFAPRAKKGLSALRGAWLASDLYEEDKNDIWVSLKLLLYKKAFWFYKEALDFMEKGKETIDNIKNFGPDLDKNFGYNGFLYIYSYLLYHYGLDEFPNLEEKIKIIEKTKIIISKVFGAGKSSRDKTVFLLDAARKLYEKINELHKELLAQMEEQQNEKEN